MAIWTQSMRTHNLTQAQNPGSCARLIQWRKLLASKPRVQRKHGTFAWVAGAVLLRETLFCFIRNLFFSIIEEFLMLHQNRFRFYYKDSYHGPEAKLPEACTI